MVQRSVPPTQGKTGVLRLENIGTGRFHGVESRLKSTLVIGDFIERRMGVDVVPVVNSGPSNFAESHVDFSNRIDLLHRLLPVSVLRSEVGLPALPALGITDLGASQASSKGAWR